MGTEFSEGKAADQLRSRVRVLGDANSKELIDSMTMREARAVRNYSQQRVNAARQDAELWAEVVSHLDKAVWRD